MKLSSPGFSTTVDAAAQGSWPASENLPYISVHTILMKSENVTVPTGSTATLTFTNH
jgi:hypothetical protein